MRTTVTLDKDVERMLRDAMHRSRSGFKQTLNAAVRAGLGQKTAHAASRTFVLKARPLGLRAGLDPAGFNQLADDLEVDAVLEKSRSGKSQ
ncbi:MAG: antitoxin [Verrucomicrobiales bacterium]|nr:antitoxin [Verrucomicrobiales bacterium]